MQASDAIHALALQILSVTIAPTVVWPDYDRSLYGAMLRVLQTGLAIDANGVISTVTPWSIPLAGASTPGSVVFVGSSGLPAQDNANFFWDDALNVLHVKNLDVATSTTFDSLTSGSVLFAGAAGVLSQDNANLFWDDTNNRLGIGTTTPNNKLQVPGLINFNDSLFNVALGTLSLPAITTGYSNVGVGYSSLQHNTTGYENMSVGLSSLQANVDGTRNVAIGTYALSLNVSGSWNMAIGGFAMSDSVGANEDTALGFGALRYYTGNNSVGMGAYALQVGAGRGNVAVGYYALNGGSVDGDYNIGIGREVGPSLTSGSENILIGHSVDVPSSSTSNHINIGNTIYGERGNKRVGIGMVPVTSTLAVAGLPTSAAGLVTGEVWIDTTGGLNILKIV